MRRVLLLYCTVLLASCRTTQPSPRQPRVSVLTTQQAVAAANHAVRTLRLPAGTKQAAHAFPWAAKISENDIEALGESTGGLIFMGGWLPVHDLVSVKGGIWFIYLTQSPPGSLAGGCIVTLVVSGIPTKAELLALLRGHGPKSARIFEAAIERADRYPEMDYFYGRARHRRVMIGGVLPSEDEPPQEVRPLSVRPAETNLLENATASE